MKIKTVLALSLLLTLSTLFAFLLPAADARAQMPLLPSKHHLEKRLSVDAKSQRISEVLNKISRIGQFYFSYSGSMFKRDSLISIDIRNLPVREVLDQIFNSKVDYKENGDYIILRYAANRLTIEPDNIITAENRYLISGFVSDIKTGLKIKQASVYEKRLLQSTLTDDKGYFKLKFKGDHDEVILTASKENYRDTTLIFLADIKIKPEGYAEQDKNENRANFGNIENSGIGRFFISSKQRIQSLNIPDFFANTPFQASLTPGLSSHGIMSSQIINKFSLNLLGGYTAGTNGFEIAGLFNISKGDVKKLQFAGLFNQVGGSLTAIQMAGLLNDVRGKKKGLQAAGLLNRVKDTAQGVQLAGISNLVATDMKGMQAAGLLNRVRYTAGGVQLAGLSNLAGKNMKGMQAAGIVNVAGKNHQGLQIAGIGNFTFDQLKGAQLAGIFNYAKKMDGFQFGLINVADSSSGYSLGLINIIKRGYHKISIYANETVHTNISIKTGNANLYSIWFVGLNASRNEKIKTAGLGFGHDFICSKRLAIGLELTGQLLYLGDWGNANLLNRFHSNLQFQLIKGLTIFGGPAYAIHYGDTAAGSSATGYKQDVVPSRHNSFSNTTKGWFGFNAGITIM